MSEIPVPDPDLLIQEGLTLFVPARVNRSVWTGVRKVVGQTGAEIWHGRATIADLATEEQERPWRAFLFALDGPQNWFRWQLPCNTHIGPKPVVGSGAGDGYELPLSGMQPNARILRAGQFMTVPLPSGHHRAVCLLADLRADASGNALATFRPELGETPAIGTTVETADPFIPMASVDSELGLTLNEGVSGVSFEVEEAR